MIRESPWNRGPSVGRSVKAAVTVCFALASTAASAQPVLLDDPFHDDVEGWTSVSSDSEIAWGPLDSGLCAPGSGSAVATHRGPGAALVRAFRPDCVEPVSDGAGYWFRVALRFPAGQDRTGEARLRATWMSAAGCTGSSLGVLDLATLTTDEAGTWNTSARFQVVPPAQARSIRLEVQVTKQEAGGELELQFDSVQVIRGVPLLVEGFEAGSFCAWSLVVGG